MIDRKRVREQFATYTRKYDSTDPKIALKIAHTYRVAEHCEEIARSLGMSDEEIDFAWISGMLHDIGRFEQVKRYGTFIDAQSVDHAEFGADLLFGPKKLIKEYIDEESICSELEIVIREHNKLRIRESVTGKTFTFCNILRDADKVDIFRVNVETPLEEIYDVSWDELLNAESSDIVMEEVRKHHVVPRGIPRTPADQVISHVALAFELVYPVSVSIARKEGYLEELLNFPTLNEKTKRDLEETRYELEADFERRSPNE